MVFSAMATATSKKDANFTKVNATRSKSYKTLFKKLLN